MLRIIAYKITFLCYTEISQLDVENILLFFPNIRLNKKSFQYPSAQWVIKIVTRDNAEHISLSLVQIFMSVSVYAL